MSKTVHTKLLWVGFNPLTQCYVTPDNTSVGVELIDTVQYLADIFFIADIREKQRGENND